MSRLQVPIIFTPFIRPEAASALRQLAYYRNLAIPGPVVDPGGWIALPTVVYRGLLSRTRPTEIRCTVSKKLRLLLGLLKLLRI